MAVALCSVKFENNPYKKKPQAVGRPAVTDSTSAKKPAFTKQTSKQAGKVFHRQAGSILAAKKVSPVRGLGGGGVTWIYAHFCTVLMPFL